MKLAYTKAIRQRPFSKITNFNGKPKSIFISMKPTEPLSIDQLFC